MASRRNYLTESELEEFADITVTNTTEMDDQISQAEEMIDAYVGPQDKFIHDILEGKVSVAGSTTSLTLDSNYVNNFPYTDYFVGCIVEIIGGTNAGQRKRCTASSSAGVLTTEAFPSAIDTTSVYRIYQIGKFPRHCDVFSNTYESPTKYYKQIPEAVKRATAAQVQYMIEMGDKFFSTDAIDRNSEHIGDYSYAKGQTSSGVAALIAPKAKHLLRGIMNRKGVLIV